MSQTTPTAAAQEDKPSRPWRDNIEAITLSIIVIVLFKYFILEAYKIPTGSMQPTLMGWSPSPGVGMQSGLSDRVLVNKAAYHYRDPERWEIAVFKYPLDRAKNFIKRVCGMPGEDLEIRGGDLFAGPHGGELKVLRRPRNVLDSMLLLLDTEDEWRTTGGGWSAEGDSLGGDKAGGLTFPRTRSGVRDLYEDGYPEVLREPMRKEGLRKEPGRNGVGDLRFEAELSMDSKTTRVRVAFLEGGKRYTFILPGPAAAAGAKVQIDVDGEVVASAEWNGGDEVSFACENIDDQLLLELDGEEVLTFDIPAVIDTAGGRLQIDSAGSGATFEEVRVLRDVFYSTAGYNKTSWEIPDGHYVMLGDNTLNSSDGRDWSFVNYSAPIDGEGETVTIRANDRRYLGLGASDDKSQPGEHPYVTRPPGLIGQGLKRVFLYDEWGDRHVLDNPTEVGTELAPYVPRELFQGRAVMVVWPFSPTRGIYRVQWVQ